MSAPLLTNAQFIERVLRLPDLLEGDDVTDGGLYWCWLTRGEWQLLYALSFAMEGAGLIDPKTDTLPRAMVAAMRYVQELGFSFKGCRATDSGRVLRTQHGVVEARNVLSLHQLGLGKVPDYETHLARAIFLAEQHYRNENLRDLLRAAQADVEATLKTIPEAPKGFREAVRERVVKLRELAQQTGTDLSSQESIEDLFRAEARKLTLEEELSDGGDQ